MTAILIILAVILVLFILWILAVRGRKGHEKLPALRSWSYAHRGLHGEGRPENSMAAFRAALEGGYGIELDVHLLADGNLAVIHDSSLKRTAGADVKIEELTTEQLENYRLEGTDEKIPLFRDVLELFAGKAPLIIELKVAGGNHAALTDATCKMVDEYDIEYCMESFHPQCVLWLKKNRPEIIRGQLTENFMKTGGKLPWIIRFCMSKQLWNFLTMPDFVAYKFADRKHLGNTLVKKLWAATRVAWTVQNKEEFIQAKKEGWIPIFENFRP